MYFRKVNARSVLTSEYRFFYVIYVNYFIQLKEMALNVDSIENALSRLRNCGSKIVLKQKQQLGMMTFL